MNEVSLRISEEVFQKISSFMKNVPSGSPVALSGGVDSSIILALSPPDSRCYVTGIRNCPDIKNARDVANLLGRKLREIVLEPAEVWEYAETVLKIDPFISKSDLGFETVLAAIMDNIEEKIILTGQGADEIFYGYSRFLRDTGMTNEEALSKLLNSTLPRERLIARHFGKEIRCPYLESGLFSIDGIRDRSAHFDGHTNKTILRKIAMELEMPPDIYGRKKKAAQYGSGFMKVILRKYGH